MDGLKEKHHEGATNPDQDHMAEPGSSESRKFADRGRRTQHLLRHTPEGQEPSEARLG